MKKDGVIGLAWDKHLHMQKIHAQNTYRELIATAYPELMSNRVGDCIRCWLYNCTRQARAHLTDNRAGDSVSGSTPAVAFALDITVRRIVNATDHFAAKHDTCHALHGASECRCMPGYDRAPRYPVDGPTYKAVRSFIIKFCSPIVIPHLPLARENYWIKTVNSVISKYASKLILYHATTNARMNAIAVDWHSNIHREPLRSIARKTSVSNTTCKRPGQVNVLPLKDHTWKRRV